MQKHTQSRGRREQISQRRRTPRELRSRRYGQWLVAPALSAILLVTLAPIGFSVYLSLNKVTAAPGGYEYTYTGLQNYKDALTDPTVWGALTFTSIYTVISVMIQIVLGLLVAIAINRMTRFAGFVLATLLVPWAMITVVSGQLWSYIFNGVYGVANYLLTSIGIIEGPINILGTSSGAFIALIVADSWKTVPFVALILFGGLRAIDSELYAAARLDGAGNLRILTKITIPLLKQSIITALIFRVLQAFGIFDLPFVLTNGGPGTSTQSIAMLGYNALFQDLNIGYGAALATLTALVIAIFSAIFLRAFKVSDAHY